MAYKLIFHPKAEKEYAKAFRWYERTQKGLGKRFEKMVEDRLSVISERPYSFKIVKDLYRQVATAVFPYVIVYQIEKEKELVYIAAICHTKRNPKRRFRKNL